MSPLSPVNLLLSIKHLHEHFLDVHGPYDRSEEELRDNRRTDGSQHGQGNEEFGEARGVLTVDQPHMLIQSLVRLTPQGLDILEAMQTLQIDLEDEKVLQ